MAELNNRTGRILGGRYMLLTMIARGGMGEVWKSRDRVTGAIVAAKVLRPELTGEEISLSRLRLEAQNAMRARHPNIAAVLDSGEDAGQGWLIMELVDGRPLSEYMGDGKRLTPQELLPLLIQTAYALDAASRADVVHRDIKPANIMLTYDGKVKLTDFGVSFADGQASLTATGMVMGTAQYLPPEQALGKPATTVGDLYALGVVAYEALAGERPFTGKNQVDIAFAHVKEAVPPLPDDVPEPLARLVYRLLEKEPAKRPQTGAALARQLIQVSGQLHLGTSANPLLQAVVPPTQQAKYAQAKPTYDVQYELPPVETQAASAQVAAASIPPVQEAAAQVIPPPASPAQAPSGNAPSGNVPSSNAPSSNAPSDRAPRAEAPVGPAPRAETSVGQAPKAEAPVGRPRPQSAAPRAGSIEADQVRTDVVETGQEAMPKGSVARVPIPRMSTSAAASPTPAPTPAPTPPPTPAPTPTPTPAARPAPPQVSRPVGPPPRGADSAWRRVYTNGFFVSRRALREAEPKKSRRPQWVWLVVILLVVMAVVWFIVNQFSARKEGAVAIGAPEAGIELLQGTQEVNYA